MIKNTPYRCGICARLHADRASTQASCYLLFIISFFVGPGLRQPAWNFLRSLLSLLRSFNSLHLLSQQRLAEAGCTEGRVTCVANNRQKWGPPWPAVESLKTSLASKPMFLLNDKPVMLTQNLFCEMRKLHVGLIHLAWYCIVLSPLKHDLILICKHALISLGWEMGN